jgi:predicted AlkP superfamily pyrophosphatase or phosphodiesterase
MSVRRDKTSLSWERGHPCPPERSQSANPWSVLAHACGQRCPRSQVWPYARTKTALFSLVAVVAFILLTHGVAHAQAKRVVVIKVDGLPYDLVDRFVRERNPRTGKSQLPWFEHVFYDGGTRVENFYVRGMSLSAPSWSLLDTGQHLQIKGNVEFDRFTLHAYDYLNFIPFYLEYLAQRRVDMPGPEVLDELGVPLLCDAYPNDERYLSFQLYQRGNRWATLQQGLQRGVVKDSPREIMDEWTIGFEPRRMLQDQLERELIEKLQNPRIHYLDYYTESFDHAAHHNRDREAHLNALQHLDAIIGRIWTAIQKTPQAAETALIIVSDHGFNTDERVYSQGFNLVKLLGSASGGGHHVITKRRLMLDYAIKGMYPLVPLITTTTPDSYYLKGQSTAYPTALVDFDGNERSSIHLRDSDLNLLHILLQQLQRKETSPGMRRALADAFFSTLDRRRAEWEQDLSQLNEELNALRRHIERLRGLVEAQPKKWTKEEVDAGRDRQAKRLFTQMDSSMGDERQYTEYARTLKNLLALRRETFDPSRVKIEDVIAKGAMGDTNTIYELQNYVVGIAPGGLALTASGSLDMQKSFVRVNYFSLLHDAAVRNNVQAGVDNHPVDFIVTRIPRERIAPQLGDDLRPDGDVIWVYGGPEQQALILSREDAAERLSLRYLPVAHLEQDINGQFRFERVAWRAGLPLKIWEDKQFGVPQEERATFLNAWHTDFEWLRALHKTEYSNALVGLNEQLSRHRTEMTDPDAPGLSVDERLLRRFRRRQRRLVEADMLVVAHDHWNFDVRGFNPGGNHGSFFRISTHSTLMFAGGESTKIPRGAVVEEPYDSLSFVPTVLALTGQLRPERTPTPVPVLWERGFRPFPGPIIQEVLGGKTEDVPPVAKGVSETP